MSPFLAQVNVINLTGDAAGPTVTAGPRGSENSAFDAAQLKADIKAKVASALKNARLETAQAKEDADSSDGDGDVTVQSGTKSVVVHHSKSKSGGEDQIFAAIPIVAIVFTFLYLIVRALMAPFTNRAKRGGQAPVVMEGLNAEEAAILEKLQRTLTQMESRVESLETILIDPTRTKEKYGSKL